MIINIKREDFICPCAILISYCDCASDFIFVHMTRYQKFVFTQLVQVRWEIMKGKALDSHYSYKPLFIVFI